MPRSRASRRHRPKGMIEPDSATSPTRGRTIVSDIRDTSGPEATGPLEVTAVLLDRIRSGDTVAREILFARFLPVIQRWAHRRLPVQARELADTDDLVQVTLIRALNRLDGFESRREGAFLAYLRTVLLNAVRDELRRARRSARAEPADEADWGMAPSELERLVGRERLDLYDGGLTRVEPDKREAVLMRLEFGYSHAEIASALGKPSADAARMMVARALAELAGA